MTKPQLEAPPQSAAQKAPQRRRLWSEYTPYAALQEPALLGELARRELQLAVAVTPELVPQLAAVLRACQAHGVAVALWPMLSDAQGRWVSADNAAAYCRLVRELLQSLAAQALLPQALAIDLEPPIERLRRLKNRRRRGARHSAQPTAQQPSPRWPARRGHAGWSCWQR